MADGAGAVALVNTVDVIDVVRAGLHRPQRIDGDGFERARAADPVFGLDFGDALRLLHVGE
jgi:hypothetical protein